MIVAAFSYTGIKYSDNEKLKDLYEKYKYDPQRLPSSKLDQILDDLNELRLSHEENNLETGSNSLQWIDSCIGLVMVEVKSRKFEKKLQKSLPGIDSVDKK